MDFRRQGDDAREIETRRGRLIEIVIVSGRDARGRLTPKGVPRAKTFPPSIDGTQHGMLGKEPVYGQRPALDGQPDNALRPIQKHKLATVPVVFECDTAVGVLLAHMSRLSS